MSIDMRLISAKDGGKFAMSWIAGTNPKALRSNFQRSHIYAVDIPEVCEHMMETIKSNEDKLSFRILFKLCLGTIHIYSEQVQQLYNVTLNFVCFNTFVLKQYSRKRTGSTVTGNTSEKKRLKSSDSLDITSLLLESEIFNEYSENKFKFPKEVGFNSGKKQNTSTCIEIKQITIRQISWDNPLPEDEEAFGEATQDDRMMLLSGLTENSIRNTQSSNGRKRKSTNETTDTSPFKKSNYTLDLDGIRSAPSIFNDTVSEFSVDLRNEPSMEVNRNIPNTLTSNFTQSEITQEDRLSQLQPGEDRVSPPKVSLNDSKERMEESLINNKIVEGIQNLTTLSETRLRKPYSLQRKRRQSHLIIDKATKLSKTDIDICIENIWLNCYNYDKKEHIASIKKICTHQILIAKAPSQRFQSPQLLISFKNNLKVRLQQEDARNRQLIIEEILGDEYEMYKSEFKLKSNKSHESHGLRQRIEEYQTLPCDEDNNVQNAIDVNNNCSPSNCCNENNEMEKEILSLKCSLDEIDLSDISFDFPAEAETQRSEWGKEGILMKLLFAWISKDSNVTMRTIIVGANRINAALAFHTLLDLAGQQFIEIIKDKTNVIESINMGPEMIRKLNEKYI